MQVAATGSLRDGLGAQVATTLYIGNLPYSASEETLRSLFSQAGAVDNVRLPTDRVTGRPRGFGFVEMASDADAEHAIQMFNGYYLDGRQIRVNLAEERAPRAGRGYGGRY